MYSSYIILQSTLNFFFGFQRIDMVCLVMTVEAHHFGARGAPRGMRDAHDTGETPALYLFQHVTALLFIAVAFT